MGRLPTALSRVRTTTWIALAVVVARVILYAVLARNAAAHFETPDTSSYLDGARALVEDHRFSAAPGSSIPLFVRTPGYPLLLVPFVAFADAPLTAIVLAQALLSGFVVGLTAALARALWSERAAVVAAVLVGLSMTQTMIAGRVLTELPWGFGILLAAWALLRGTRAANALPWYLLVAASLVAATFVRPVTYYLVPVALVLGIVVMVRTHARSGSTVAILVVTALAGCALVGSWQVRNHAEVGSWRFSGIEAVNMYEYRAAGTIAERDGRSVTDVREELVAELPPVPSNPADVGPWYDDEYRRGLAIVREDPQAAALTVPQGAWSLLFGVAHPLEFLGLPVSGPVGAAARLLVFASYVPILAGVVLALRRRRDLGVHLFILGVTAYTLVVSAGPEANARFRGPIEPFLCLYAAIALTALWDWWRRRRRPRGEGSAASAHQGWPSSAGSGHPDDATPQRAAGALK